MPDAEERTRLETWRILESLAPELVLDAHPDCEMLRFLAASAAVRRGRARLLYLRSGQEALLELEAALAACGRPLPGFGPDAAVLEMACGYGRVTRHLLSRVDRSRLWCCDVVPPAVEHVADAFGVQTFLSHEEPERVEWPRRFDLVFVASLFSHLPRHRFESWLRRLREALADDGLLVFSTHGRDLPMAPQTPAEEFVFVPRSESTALSAAEYGTTFVTPERVELLARAAGFASVACAERGLWSLQDLFVASPKTHLPSRIAPLPYLDGAIEELRIDASRTFWARGWASNSRGDGPVAGAELHLDGRRLLDLPLHAAVESRESSGGTRLASAWTHVGVVGAEFAGRHALALVVRSAGGARRCADVRTIDLGPGAALRFVDGVE